MVDTRGAGDVRNHPTDSRISYLHYRQLEHGYIHLVLSVSDLREPTSTLLTCYSDIPLVITAYLLWKFIKRTKIQNLSDIPLEEALQRAAEDPGIEEKLPPWRKIVGFLWD